MKDIKVIFEPVEASQEEIEQRTKAMYAILFEEIWKVIQEKRRVNKQICNTIS